MTTPSVGRFVHYVSHGSADGTYPSVCRAAVVTEVDTYHVGPSSAGVHIEHVGLAVFNPTGLHLPHGVLQDEDEHRPGTWHWPEGSPAAAQDNPVDVSALLAKVREVRDIQGRDGNWDFNAYQNGLYNGLELAMAILEDDRAPVFRDAPFEGYRSERASTPASEKEPGRVVVNISGMTVKDVDPRKVAEDVAAALGRPRKVERALLTATEAARICHEANRALQLAIGEPDPSPHWEDAPDWQRDAAIAGIEVAQGGASAEELHEAWTERKRAEGWAYGPVKDADAKTHPCLVPYAELPPEQRLKDALFSAIVKAVT